MTIHAHAANGDVAALEKETANNNLLEGRDENGQTPLMVAVASPCAHSDTLRLLIKRGANVNAVARPKGKRGGASVLGVAARSASLDKIRTLVEAGADVCYVDASGYSILLNAVYRSFSETAQKHHEVLDYLVVWGAPLDAASKHGESVLSVASHRGEFAQVRLFLERGADPKPLDWEPLFYAVAFGSAQEVISLLDQGSSLDDIDAWERTPFLLSVHAGRQDIAELLLQRGSDRSATGRCGKTALMYAIDRSDAPMLKWLISERWDVEEADEFGNFPLIQAAQHESTACVEVLLQAGARAGRRDEFDHSAIRGAASPEIVHLLVAAGQELSDVDSSMRARLLGGKPTDGVEVSKHDYGHHCHRKFGIRNPDRMNNAFWESMVRTRESAYFAAAKCGDTSIEREPVWCCQRFGQSMTKLPDGRYVEIGGEHEDYYDVDFCIYNDVIVHGHNGTFDIFGYPEPIFPPTDFHSATFVAPYIYVIGSLGYSQQRQPGDTPVYRLHCDTWTMEVVRTAGKNPGWIYGHQARLVAGDQVWISGGKIIDAEDEESRENKSAYFLDLQTITWRLETSIAEP